MEPLNFRTRVRHLGVWTFLTTILIVALGLFAFIQAPEATRSYGVSLSYAGWAIIVLFLVSLTNVAVARFLMLPALARRKDASPDRIATMAYLLSLTPAIYGIASVALSGARTVGLPFALLSLFAVADLWALFSGAYEKAQVSRAPEVVHEVEASMAGPGRGAKETAA